MDFMNRSQQSNGGRPNTVFSAGAQNEQPGQPEQSNEHKSRGEKAFRGGSLVPGSNKWFRWGGSAAVIIVALLIGAALALLLSFRPPTEGDLVDSNKLQAVFLTNDQVYFGKITEVNSKYVVLTKIYYLQTSSTGTDSKAKTTGNNISLVKLGCELHKPQDRMVISQDQVSFWENLQADGQVAKAVKSYQDANPNGQTCDKTNTNTNPVQGGTGATNTTNTNATTNPNANTNKATQ
jgi:hypothetical protein